MKVGNMFAVGTRVIDATTYRVYGSEWVGTVVSRPVQVSRYAPHLLQVEVQWDTESWSDFRERETVYLDDLIVVA
jgi:hypothetical protein